MKRSPSTMSRELKRCSGKYSANTAENDYHLKILNIFVNLGELIMVLNFKNKLATGLK